TDRITRAPWRPPCAVSMSTALRADGGRRWGGRVTGVRSAADLRQRWLDRLPSIMNPRSRRCPDRSAPVGTSPTVSIYAEAIEVRVALSVGGEPSLPLRAGARF